MASCQCLKYVSVRNFDVVKSKRKATNIQRGHFQCTAIEFAMEISLEMNFTDFKSKRVNCKCNVIHHHNYLERLGILSCLSPIGFNRIALMVSCIFCCYHNLVGNIWCRTVLMVATKVSYVIYHRPCFPVYKMKYFIIYSHFHSLSLLPY